MVVVAYYKYQDKEVRVIAMKNAIKKMAALMLGLSMLLGMAGCDFSSGLSKQDAVNYVQWLIDAAYLGKFNEKYVDLVEGSTMQDLEDLYESNVVAEAEAFRRYMSIEVATDEQVARSEELIRTIYSHSKYEVLSSNKLESGNYVVEVKVSPIDILQKVTDEDINTIWGEVTANVDQNTLNTMSDDEYSALEIEYTQRVLDLVESLIPSLGYEKDQNVALQLILDSDGYYVLSDDDWINLDYKIIDYTGDYA